MVEPFSPSKQLRLQKWQPRNQKSPMSKLDKETGMVEALLCGFDQQHEEADGEKDYAYDSEEQAELSKLGGAGACSR